MRNQGIDWDDDKAATNLKKHGLSFDIAQKVFDDKNLIEIYDHSHSNWQEDRYMVIGEIKEYVVVNVVFEDKKTGIKQIITARYASRSEKRMYYERRRNFGVI